VTSSSPPLEVDVFRSARRKKTARWHVKDGRVCLEVPAKMAGRQVERLVEQVREQARQHLLRAELAEQHADAELLRRAREVARRYVPQAADRLRSADWSARQGRRWGSCDASVGRLRISDRLRRLPRFVLEYVLVHEVAHLLEPNHGPAFHQLTRAYPWAERAKGFLLAIDMGAASGETDGRATWDPDDEAYTQAESPID
jgi:predicted metal-dependent hydrolase